MKLSYFFKPTHWRFIGRSRSGRLFCVRLQKGFPPMNCPHCGKKNVSYWHVLGHAGGRTKGSSKARTRKQAQKAINTRWHPAGTRAAKVKI
jgi:predicted amidophosphoribosyltransferase